MRHNLFLYPFATMMGLSIGTVRATTTKNIKPPSKSVSKGTELKGKVVLSDDLDLKLTIPEGWKSAPPSPSPQLNETLNSSVYFHDASVQAVITQGGRPFYNPPQFYVICKDLSREVDINEISQSSQDEIMRATLERTYKEVLNFRYEGGSHVQVDGEPATAFAAVATMKVTDDIMKFRVVSIFRNKRFYMFVFGAPIDEFPRFDPVFKKILQNYHFRTPRKKNTPPLIAPADAPAKNPGTI